MKKNIIGFFIFFILATPKLYSQNSDRQFKVTIDGGLSFPVGKFGSSAFNPATSQNAAKPGPAAAFTLAYRLKNSHFGLKIIAGWQQNNVNNTAIARSMFDFYPSGSQIGAKSDNWHIWKWMAGPTIETPLSTNGKVSLEFNAVAGILKTKIPGYKYTVIYPDQNTVEFEARAPISLAASFCYQVSACLNYRITRSLFLNGDLSFMHSAPVHVFTYYLGPNYPMPVIISQTYPISSVNLLVGIGYIL